MRRISAICTANTRCCAIFNKIKLKDARALKTHVALRTDDKPCGLFPTSNMIRIAHVDQKDARQPWAVEKHTYDDGKADHYLSSAEESFIGRAQG
jgi:hypothetical protein